MLYNVRKFIAVSGFFFISISILSQISTYSPFSRYGLGEIYKNGNAESIGMGGIGIGFRPDNQINYLNPASYTSQDTMSFIFDVAIRGNLSRFETDLKKNDRFNIYFDHAAMAFPITRWLKTSVGVMPFSFVGYNQSEKYLTTDSLNINYIYKGSGGIDKFYLGSSVELFRHLSLGVNMLFYFGSIIHDTQIVFPIDSSYYNVDLETKNYFRALSFDAGLQYYQKIGDNFKFTLGLTYDRKTPLKAREESTSYSYYGAITDTVYSSANKLNNVFIPQKIGAGISMNLYNRLDIAVDYSERDWSNTYFRNINQSLSKFNSLNIGLKYVPNKLSYRSYSDHIEYRIGYHQSRSGITTDGIPLLDEGFSLGIGLPMRGEKTMFNLALDFGQFGTPDKNLIGQKYAIITFDLILYDFWFIKRKYD